ncbi:hypothetical protein [Spartinivicinus poritis]|uniref:Uncharacterized protein n=1 Tax=Spartinivicinus poritis TaxID=2994640 RepID=A0ABT5UH53_9GAMM|nr:hypothetical protein [Spartinivicinus sp. A2-2]MDE1465540.1 hypothetical protein [Spartinivicinus sp. A2-2]
MDMNKQGWTKGDWSKNIACSFLGTILLGATFASFAKPPFEPDLVKNGNRWLITFYNDADPKHAQWATQGLCFYYAPTAASSTQQRYYWVSDTYPDWNGMAAQEGDQVFMHGDFQWPYGNPDGGHDGMEWSLVAQPNDNIGIKAVDIGAGHWKEWVENGHFGRTIGFGNTLLRRVGKCNVDSAKDALEKYRHLPRRDDIESPMGIKHKDSQ